MWRCNSAKEIHLKWKRRIQLNASLCGWEVCQFVCPLIHFISFFIYIKLLIFIIYNLNVSEIKIPLINTPVKLSFNIWWCYKISKQHVNVPHPSSYIYSCSLTLHSKPQISQDGKTDMISTPSTLRGSQEHKASQIGIHGRTHPALHSQNITKR